MQCCMVDRLMRFQACSSRKFRPKCFRRVGQHVVPDFACAKRCRCAICLWQSEHALRADSQRMHRVTASFAARLSTSVPAGACSFGRSARMLCSDLMRDIWSAAGTVRRPLSSQPAALTSLRNFRGWQLAPAHPCSGSRGTAAACTTACSTAPQEPQPGRRSISCSAVAPLDATALRQSGYDASQIQVTCHASTISHAILSFSVCSENVQRNKGVGGIAQCIVVAAAPKCPALPWCNFETPFSRFSAGA